MEFFSALLDEWTLDAGCNQLWENPGLLESTFQLDVDSPSGSSGYPQPTAASNMVGLEDASNLPSMLTVSPSSNSSSVDDIVGMDFNPAFDFEGFQWPQSEESSSSTPAQSVAEECNAAPRIILMPPQPLVFPSSIQDLGFSIDRASASWLTFDVAIDRTNRPGKLVFDAPWAVSVVYLQLRDLMFLNFFSFDFLQFSGLMNKLFVNRDKMCPMTFKSTIPGELLGQFRVAVHVSFADLQDLYEPVRRCRNDATNDPELEPLMACRHPRAEAESRDGHHTVLVPLDGNNSGHLSAVASFTFSCLNTCRSIMRLNKKNGKWEKRALKLHFRLETRR